MSSIAELEESLIDYLDTYRNSSATLPVLKGSILRQCIELLAHASPANARKVGQSSVGNKVQSTVRSYEEHYTNLLKLSYTTFREVATVDPNLQRRIGALSFFQDLYTEMQTENSYLPPNPAMDRAVTSGTLPLATFQSVLRSREIALLSSWLTAATHSIASNLSNAVVASSLAAKAILAANAVARPALRCIARCIDAAEDRNATQLYGPLMGLLGAVFDVLLNNPNNESTKSDGGLRAACVKFTETVVLCFSNRQGKAASANDFAIEDLPIGHPTISREEVKAVGEEAFQVLRGWVESGGQVTISIKDLLDDDIVNLKPALLSYLATQGNDSPPSSFAWRLDQKGYAIAVNALAIIGSSRVNTFTDVATTISKLTADPPKETATENGEGLTKAGVLSTKSAITASALKLLRTQYSIQSKTAEMLKEALTTAGIGSQATKAYGVAVQNEKLSKSSRAARNRANLMYTWESEETVGSKRKQMAKEVS